MTMHSNHSSVGVLYFLIVNQSGFGLFGRTMAHLPLYMLECAIGLVLNVAFVYFAAVGIRRRHLPAALYLFLICRSVADSIMQAAILLFSFAVRNPVAPFASDGGEHWWPALQRVLIVVSLVVATGNFYVSMTCYWCLSALVLLSVRRPLLYQRRVTAKLCVRLVICSACIAILFGMLRVRPGQPQACLPDDGECVQAIRASLRTGTLIFTMLYVTTLTFYGFVAWESTKLAPLPHESSNRSGAKRISFKKLGMGIGTFGLFNLVVLLDRLAASFCFNNCLPFGHICYSVMVHPITYHALVIRSVIDPLAGVFADTRLKNIIAVMLGVRHRGIALNSTYDTEHQLGQRRQMSTTNTPNSIGIECRFPYPPSNSRPGSPLPPGSVSPASRSVGFGAGGSRRGTNGRLSSSASVSDRRPPRTRTTTLTLPPSVSAELTAASHAV